jgi:hypothetical protein
MDIAKMLWIGRVTLALSTGAVLTAWGIAGYVYAVDGGGEYNGGLFASFIFVATTLTVGAASLVVGAWREKVRPVYAALVSVLAALSTLWLAVAINLRG